MRLVLLAASLLLPLSAFVIGCGRDQQARTSSASPASLNDALPATITLDHQPPPRTPEN